MQLVNEPRSERNSNSDNFRKVEQIRVNYQNTVNFVDVKALKDSIWSELHTKQVCIDCEFTSLVQKGKSQPEKKKFSELLRNVPKKLQGEDLQNVTVPYCFICLLHLANEKGLTIDQTPNNLTELFIQERAIEE